MVLCAGGLCDGCVQVTCVMVLCAGDLWLRAKRAVRTVPAAGHRNLGQRLLPL